MYGFGTVDEAAAMTGGRRFSLYWKESLANLV